MRFAGLSNRLKMCWVVFSVGVSLPAIGWVYWMARVGPSWWFAYRNPGEDGLSIGQKAERVRMVMWIIGILVCAAAPLLSRASLERRFLLLPLAALAAVCAFYVAEFITMYGFLGW